MVSHKRFELNYNNSLSRLIFLSLHLFSLVGLWFFPPNFYRLSYFILSYTVLALGVTLGYHRLIAHRAFQTSRYFQFLLSFLACVGMQKGPLWWAYVHRYHHKNSDTEEDCHSPRKGFWWAHLKWNQDSRFHSYDAMWVRDLLFYPELLFLERKPWMPALVWGLACFSLGGAELLVYGFLLSSVVVLQMICAVGSLAHMVGRQSYSTQDQSRNHWFLGYLFFGEGWHNNHHWHPSRPCFGDTPRQVDIGYRVLCFLERIGCVSLAKPSVSS